MLSVLFIVLFILLLSMFLTNCDPFEDLYVILSLNTELNTIATDSTVDISSYFCLNDFEDYKDNKDKLVEVRYLSSVYLTLSATQGLQGNKLVLSFYQANEDSLIFQFTQQSFLASDYINEPLEIKLSQQDINDLNRYLSNAELYNCFQTRLQIFEVQYQGPSPYFLNSKVEFLTELKVKP